MKKNIDASPRQRHLALPVEVHQRVRALAQRTDRSMVAVIRRLLDEVGA